MMTAKRQMIPPGWRTEVIRERKKPYLVARKAGELSRIVKLQVANQIPFEEWVQYQEESK